MTAGLFALSCPECGRKLVLGDDGGNRIREEEPLRLDIEQACVDRSERPEGGESA